VLANDLDPLSTIDQILENENLEQEGEDDEDDDPDKEY